MLKKFDLQGRTALITGGAGLLGIEHAAALLESGCSIVLTDINQAALDAAKDYLINASEKVVLLFTQWTCHKPIPFVQWQMLYLYPEQELIFW